MRLLIGCEESGVVTAAFRKKGVNAWSCDLIDTRGNPEHHIKADVFSVLEYQSWDGLIAFPPCTRLCRSGARWWPLYASEHEEALDFVERLMMFPKHVIENPIGAIGSRIRKPDQIIQPWMFGHGEVKATCLWLRGFPKLAATHVVSGRYPAIHYMAPGPNRSRDRSKTYQGIADAMAMQWCEQ